MQVSLSVENLPIQERITLVGQLLDSIMLDIENMSIDSYGENLMETTDLLRQNLKSCNMMDMVKHVKQPTKTIEQVVARLQMMSEEQQKQVFLFIDFICWQDGIVLAENEEIKP